jgi:rhodanese-related sulfurtransferase
LESIFGGVDLSKAPKLRIAGAGMLVVIAAAVLVIGQPTTSEKWSMLAVEKEPLLVQQRAYQIHPGELLDLMHNDGIKLFMIDVRTESEYNLFHLHTAQNITLDELPEHIPNYLLEPSNAVFVVMSNTEEHATEAWKMMAAENVHNVYMLEGGLNYWLDVFEAQKVTSEDFTLHAGDEELHYSFDAALGDRHAASNPDPHEFELEYKPKVKLELKKGPSGGGCG